MVAKVPRGPHIKAGGIGQYFEESGCNGRLLSEVYESTCAHAHCGQHITQFKSRREMMDHVDICRSCMKLICLFCVGKPCLPAEKACEMIENESRLRSKISIQSWDCY